MVASHDQLGGLFYTHLAAQDELSQLRGGRRRKLSGQDGKDARAMGQQGHHGQDAPLCTRVGAQQRLSLCEALGIVGNLPLQEAACIGAGESQNPQMRQSPRVCADRVMIHRIMVPKHRNDAEFSGKLCAVTPCDEDKPSPPVVPAAPEPEVGGPEGPEPTRFGDWERRGRCIDF